jgi:hypothetical protein
VAVETCSNFYGVAKSRCLCRFYGRRPKSAWQRYAPIALYRPSRTEPDAPMLDAILIAASCAVFLAACGYALLCELM